ncbi:MAG: glycosyltransferase [Candidatus Hodarchaeota archaeon]
MLSYEDKLTLDADLIFCVSLKLYEEKLKYRQKNVYYLPHGVDFHHFYRATRALPLPDDIKPIKPPIVGYFGSLTNRNDQSIIEYCATKRPDFSFVLLGQVLGNYQFLQNLPNVHFLGYKDYAKLPNYGKAFDVCIMFWKTSEWIEYCNPVKTMEYLAMGKPVVSVPIAEISRKFHGLISIANSPEQFLRKIEEELRNNNLSKQKERTQSVTNETWNARALQISEIITNYTIQ